MPSASASLKTDLPDRRLLILLVGVSLLAACSDSASPESTAATTTTPPTTTSVVTTTPATTTALAAGTGTAVVMDTDMAAEGTMSILYLLGRPEVNVRAITVSGTGLVHCEPGVRQALGLVELAGAGDIPVACGPEEPLAGFNTFPTSWRVGADEAYGLELPYGGAPSNLPAPELLASVIAASPTPLVVYTDGPLTNLAAAIRLDPGIVGNIAMVYTMGGAIDVPGTTIRNPDAEWNIWVDPVAAAEVFASGVRLTLVPLDATNQVPLHIFHLRALQEHQDTPEAAAVVTMLEGNAQLAEGTLYFWDQLAAALLVDESLAEFETMRLVVVTEGERDVAGRTERAPGGDDVRVATVIDSERFEREFLSALAGEDTGPIVVEADITADFDGENWTLTFPESAAAGDCVISFTNRSSVDALVAFGWLTADATEADMLAWTSVDQPPFYELVGYAYSAPGARTIAVIHLSQPGTHYIEGLDYGQNLASNLGKVEVSE